MAVDIRLLTLGDRYTRPELAELWGYRGYQALARGVVTPAAAGVIILFVTHMKQQALTQYKDFISGDYLYWEGEERHATDERVAYAHDNGEEIHLFYRDVHHTSFQYRGPLEIRRFIPHDNKPSEFVFRLVHDLGVEDDLATHADEIQNLPTTEREAVIKARVGQGEFRDRLLKLWRSCAITGVEEPAVLRASHIKPWRKSSNSERLNRYNGLLLLPQYDHLFDRGLITFEDDGRLVPSEVIERIPASTLGVDPQARLRRVQDEHVPFLQFHREHVFASDTVD
jgi:putative restriction endonuclease